MSFHFTGNHTVTCQNPIFCKVSIKEPYGGGQKTATILKEQMVRTNQVDINKNGEITRYITQEGEPRPNEVVARSSDSISVSFTLVLKDFDESMQSVHDNETYHTLIPHGKPPKAEELMNNMNDLGLTVNEDNEYFLIMRFPVTNKRRGSVRLQHSKLKQYMEGRRKRVTIRETKAPDWKGVVSFVFGIFSVLLTCILGQFWEEDKRPFVSRRNRKVQPPVRCVNGRNAAAMNHKSNIAYGTSSGTVRGRHSVANRRK